MEFVDTHCHIHEAVAGVDLQTETKKRYEKSGLSAEEMLDRAYEVGVSRLIVVGTTLEDSELAVEFAAAHDNVWASIGLHPHEAKTYANNQDALVRFAALASHPKVVAIGECGLDYYYNHSLPAEQEIVLRFQIELALKHNLPMIFHVRNAFDDFWPIFEDYSGVRGVVHSFSSSKADLKDVLDHKLFVGLNGITTFSKDEDQLEAFKRVPLDKMLLETDAPFLAPVPHRGKICEPKYVRDTAEFLAKLRGEKLDDIAAQTTQNAKELFKL